MQTLKKHIVRFVLAPATVLILLSGAVSAHDTAPAHQCERPEIPERFITQEQADQFMEKANSFQQCINTFIETQNAAAEVHRKAGEDALSTWNTFASEVNAKTKK